MTTIDPILYYVVFIGRTCGIKKSYKESIDQTIDYPGGFFEVYVCREDAVAAIEKFTSVPYSDKLDFYDRHTDNK